MSNPELLSQLRDIHTPEPVGWWPLAPGWWILLALIIIGVTALIVWLRSKRKRVTAISESLRQLKQLPDSGGKQELVTLLQLFRRAALVYHSREQVAAVSLDHLAKSIAQLHGLQLSTSSLELMRDAQYRPDTQIDPLQWQQLKADIEMLLPGLAQPAKLQEAQNV